MQSYVSGVCICILHRGRHDDGRMIVVSKSGYMPS
jgi:hypothetical protein